MLTKELSVYKTVARWTIASSKNHTDYTTSSRKLTVTTHDTINWPTDSIIMTGKCNLQLCTVELLATALLLLVTHSLSVPPYKRSEDGSGVNLEVQNIEKLYTTVLEKVHFQRTNLTLEVRKVYMHSAC